MKKCLAFYQVSATLADTIYMRPVVLIKKVSILLRYFGLSAFFSLSAMANESFVYHGQLMDSSGNPITATTNFQIKIHTDDNDDESPDCQLYQEDHLSIVPDPNDGSFTLHIGKGTSKAGAGSLAEVFKRSGFVAGAGCNIMSPTSPRLLEVIVEATSLSPLVRIQDVPFALNALAADNATKLGGKVASDFIQDDGTVTQAALNSWFNSTQLGHILAGTYNASSANTATTATNVTGVVAIANGGTGQTTAPAALNALLPNQTGNAGKFLKTDGSTASWASAGGGTVSQVTSANGDITVINDSTTPQLTLNSATTGGGASANKVAKLDGSGLLATSMIPNLDTAKITSGVLDRARLGSGTADSTKYLRGDGSWQTLPPADNLGNHTAAASLQMTGHTIYGHTITSGDLTLDSTSNPTKGKIILNPSGGNVGIGTSSPTATLEIAGQIKITGGSPGSGKVLQSDASGLATWATGGSESTTVSNVGTGGIGVYRDMSSAQINLKNINASSSAITVTDDGVNNEVDIGVNLELGGLAGLNTIGIVKRTGAGTYSTGNVSLTTDVTGVLPVDKGGTGQNTYANGELLIGNTTGNTLTKATLTPGSGISIINGNGSITIDSTLGTSVDLATSEATGILPVGNGGTGTSLFTANHVIVSNGTGTAFAALSCNNGEVIKFDVSGFAGCGADNTGSVTAFEQDGNAFNGLATLGTNDNNSLAFETNGTEKMRILTNGNVGIGTPSPTVKLDVAGHIRSTAGEISASTSNPEAYLTLKANGTPEYRIRTTGSNLYIRDATAGQDRVTIDSAGNVGIGTTTPSPHLKLQVQGAAASRTNTINTGATVNLALGNTQLVKLPGGSTINLQNLVDGASYTIIISDTASRTYTFSGCSSQYFSPPNGPTSDRSAYTILAVQDTAGLECYITWITGFQ